MEKNSQPAVTIVIIGRNEARNLPACIQSIREMNYPQDLLEVIYIDTSSSDGSPEVARACGVTVYEESGKPPTAALARNRGLKEASSEIIHFIDGDMTLDPDYLANAVQYLGKNNVVCVFGRLLERSAKDNWIANLLDYPWKMKTPGPFDAPGAGGTFLRSALLEVGGYNPNLARGEETELGLKLRNLGYQVLMIDHYMGIHDYGITTLAGVWGKYISMGRHFGSLLQMNNSGNVTLERQTAKKSAFQAAITFCGVIFIILTKWYWLMLAAPLVLFTYVLARYWQTPNLRSTRLGYFLLEYFFKPAIWWGMLQTSLTQGNH